jgi:hypothetical protein
LNLVTAPSPEQSLACNIPPRDGEDVAGECFCYLRACVIRSVTNRPNL